MDQQMRVIKKHTGSTVTKQALNPDLWATLEAHVTSEKLAESAYEAGAIAFDAMGWEGLSKWARGESQNELSHAQKFIDYLNNRNRPARLDAIPAPTSLTGMPVLDIFQAFLALEEKVTGEIEDLYSLAVGLDHRTVVFLQWFLEEQYDSEKELSTLISQLMGADKTLIAQIDERLGE